MTAVEWLVEQFEQVHTQRKWKEIIEQAKQMEKQQIIDAYVEGGRKGFNEFADDYEQYYNDTYNLQQ
jgi:hypothetical protein